MDIDNFVQVFLFLPNILCKGITKTIGVKTQKKRQRKQTPTHTNSYKKLKKKHGRR